MKSDGFRTLCIPDIEWALQIENLKLNNHGLMLATSVLVAGAFVANSHPVRAAQMIQYGCDSIVFILKSVFGNDGYCNENSPFYSHFYITKLKVLKEDYSAFLETEIFGGRRCSD